ncbi:transporter [Niastella koreensis]|uniref:Outer membrane efflux protein n=2 Tax=Niastella koreensis TaxID=354356 RepID=G8TKB8_NIAKG|nr:TolC family protein [Niastella koreensis]AEV97574.1 outer membrane efflux protein [Niastella koreensis GR20-10]OQP47617.1 transporter [Niastella koreensis]
MLLRKTFLVLSIAMSMNMDGRSQSITGRPLSLQECVQAAWDNNLDVKQGNFSMERAAVTWRQSKANLLPNVGGEIDHTLNQGRSIDLSTNSYVNQQVTSGSYQVSANVTLFNGLRLMNTLKSSQYAYEASKMELQTSKDQLMLNVILAYLQILTSGDLLQQSQKTAEVAQKQVERLELMNEQGAIKPSDLTDLKGLLADNKVSIITNQNALDGARLSLAQLMNTDYNSNLQVERLRADQVEMNYTTTTDSIFTLALQQLAIIKAADLRTKSAEKAVQAARGNLFPSVGLGGGFYTPYSSAARDSSSRKIEYYDQLSNNYRTYVGIGISIPIFNNFRYRNQIALAKIDLKNAEFTSKTRQIQLKQNIEQDYFNMTAAKNKYQALQEQVAAYAESFRAAEVRFNNGAATSVDYLIAKNNLDRANINLIIAKYDYVLRTKILDYYQGKALW